MFLRTYLAYSLFMISSLVITFYFINGFATNAEIFVGKFFDGYSEELLRDMGYLGGCSRETFNQLFLLLCGKFTTFDGYVGHGLQECL